MLTQGATMFGPDTFSKLISFAGLPICERFIASLICQIATYPTSKVFSATVDDSTSSVTNGATEPNPFSAIIAGSIVEIDFLLNILCFFVSVFQQKVIFIDYRPNTRMNIASC